MQEQQQPLLLNLDIKMIKKVPVPKHKKDSKDKSKAFAMSKKKRHFDHFTSGKGHINFIMDIGKFKNPESHSIPVTFYDEDNIIIIPKRKVSMTEGKLVVSNIKRQYQTTASQILLNPFCTYQYKVIRARATSSELCFGDFLKLFNDLLNDKIINFYLKMLEDQFCPDDNILVFNSYLYQILSSYNETGSLKEPLFNYEKTINKKLDIFNFDYLVIPVCEKNHWTIMIVRNPAGIEQASNEDAVFSFNEFSDSPSIFYLDSYYSYNDHPKATNIIKKWLIYEYAKKVDQAVNLDTLCSKSQTIRVYTPVLPKQDNSIDCGVFILAYADMFFFSPEKFINRMLKEIADSIFEKEYTVEKRIKIQTLLMNMKVNQENAIRLYVEQEKKVIPHFFPHDIEMIDF